MSGRAALGPLPAPGPRYDRLDETNFRRVVEQQLRVLSAFAGSVASLVAHATSHASDGTDPVILGTLAGALTAAQHGDLSATAGIFHHWNQLTGVPATFPPEAHALVSATHTASGLTAGHFLRATSATEFAFGTAASTDLSDSTNIARLDAANVFSHVSGQQMTRLGIGVAPSYPFQMFQAEVSDVLMLLGNNATALAQQTVNIAIRPEAAHNGTPVTFLRMVASASSQALLLGGGSTTRGATSLEFQTAANVSSAPVGRWRVLASGALVPLGSSFPDLGASANRVATGYFTNLNVLTTITFGAPLGVASGGTGRATLTSANLLVGAATSAVNFLAPGTAGQVVRSTGSAWASAALEFADLSGSIANAQVPVGSVTQHQAALAIAASQVSAGAFGAGEYAFPGTMVVGTDPGVFGTFRIGGGATFGSADPRWVQVKTTAAANEKRWDWFVGLTKLELGVVNDAGSGGANWCEVTRSGIVISSVAFPGSAVIVGTDPGGPESLRISGGGRFTGGIVQQGTSVEQDYNRTDGAADEKSWNWFPSTTTFEGRLLNDTRTVGTSWLRITRSGMTVVSVAFPNSPVIIGTDPGGSELLRVGGAVRGRSLGLGMAAPGDEGQIALDGTNNQLAIFSRDTGAEWILYNSGGVLRFYQAGDKVIVNADGTVVIGGDPGGSDLLRVGGTVRLGVVGSDITVGNVSGRLRIIRASASQINMLTEGDGFATLQAGTLILGTDPGGSEALRLTGTARISALAGTGTRAVVADANGVLSAP